ncbi:serine/threonine protein phosphatase [Chlamydiales bacterium]|nr:serine/threonine protein phosphatase [Chlamydiales bacterium]
MLNPIIKKRRVDFTPEPPPIAEMLSVKSLMDNYLGTKKIQFNEDRLFLVLDENRIKFKMEEVQEDKHFGAIKKLEVSPGDTIFVEGDIHGDLQRVVDHLQDLKRQGYLDENYHCRESFHCLFLGDYVDRGQFGREVLELLGKLRLENPEQVHLIQGNHEDIEYQEQLKDFYQKFDPGYYRFFHECNIFLKPFHDTLPLAYYVGVKGNSDPYLLFTHALFEPSMVTRWAGDESIRVVPRKRNLSDITLLIKNSSKEVKELANKLYDLCQKSMWNHVDMTLWNWGDVDQNKIDITTEDRGWKLNLDAILPWMKLNHIQAIFRGHQHEFSQLIDTDGKVKVTTLPCSFLTQSKNDQTYILEAPKEGKEWEKRVLKEVNSVSIFSDKV